MSGGQFALLRAFGPAVTVCAPVRAEFVAEDGTARAGDVVGLFATEEAARECYEFDRETARQVAALIAERRRVLYQMIEERGVKRG